MKRKKLGYRVFVIVLQYVYVRVCMYVCMYLCVNVYISTRVFTFTQMGEGSCNIHQIGRVLFYAARVQLSLFNFNINL